MALELKEIKSRYTAKCIKCSRDIRVGWTVYIDPAAKVIYCKPCATPMLANQTKNSNEKVTDNQFDMLLDMLSKQSEMLYALNEQIYTLVTQHKTVEKSKANGK